MTLILIPEIENIVLESCKDLISQYHFTIQKKLKNEVLLLSQKCGIRIMAGISPLGERQIETDFFNPLAKNGKEKYYSHTFLLYLGNRSEPRDVLRTCGKDKEKFEDALNESLKCFTAHTLKYRQDILDGDFTSWLPKEE